MSEFNPSHEIAHSYEPLTDEEFGNRLAAIGNHEAKALAYLMLEKGREYGRQEVTARLKQVCAPLDRPLWTISADIYSYFGWSLEPVGLLVKSVAVDGKLKYIKEQEDPSATALAGSLLRRSRDTPTLHLNGLLSDTQSNSKAREKGLRSPLRRLQIMEYVLANAESLSIAGLTDTIGEEDSHTTTNHVEGLAAQGLLTYKGVHPAEIPLIVTYINTLDRPTSSRYKTMAGIVKKVLSEAQAEGLPAEGLSRNELLGRIHRGYALDIGERHLVTSVTKILIDLANQGALRISDGNVREEFSITPSQQIFLNQIVQTLRGIQAGEPQIVASSLEQATAIINNQETVTQLLRKAYERSSKTSPIGTLRMSNLVLRVLREDGNLTTAEVQERVSTILGKKVGERVVAAALSQQKKRGKITATVLKPNKNLWSPLESERLH